MSSISDYQKSMTVYGKITGIKPYGAFVSFENGVTGLIHISEISNGFVKDINNYIKVGEYVLLKVIDIDVPNRQLRLSFKGLPQNTRKHMRRVKFLGLPTSTKGFGSIAEKMPNWLRGEYND